MRPSDEAMMLVSISIIVSSFIYTLANTYFLILHIVCEIHAIFDGAKHNGMWREKK